MDFFGVEKLNELATSIEDKMHREKVLISKLLNVFLNPRKIIENKEYFNFDLLLKNNGTINSENFSVYSLIKINYKVVRFAKGDHDSTIKKTKSYEYFIFYNDNLILDKYVYTIVPDNQDISENIETWSIRDYANSEEFNLNKHLTKKIQMKYSLESHRKSH